MHLLEHLHQGQKRKDGSAYTTHLYAVREILETAGVTDKTLLAAALLHDILEDSALSKEYLALKFGERVADIVEFLTKNAAWNTAYCRMKSNLDEMETIWMDYPEAILIKMADRLHNLRTITGFTLAKQREYLTETTDCLMPLFVTIGNRNHRGFKKYIQRLLPQLQQEIAQIAQRLALTPLTHGHQH